MVDTIIIFSARVARDLFRKKYELMDFKQDKFNPIKTVFFFKRTEELIRYLEVYHNIIIQ